MNAPAIDLASYLVAQSVGTLGATSGWSINVSKEPATPDSTVTIYDTGSAPTDPDNSLYPASCQVRVRGTGYATVYAKCEEIRDALLNVISETIGGTLYVGLWMVNGPEAIEYDENDRVIFVMNFDILRESV